MLKINFIEKFGLNLFSSIIVVTLLFLSTNVCTFGQSENDISKELVGKWLLKENERASAGEIVFTENNKYELIEVLKDKDKTKVSRKGIYILDTKANPVKIDLCLGDCNQPGSEWVTLFCIIRIMDKTNLEIRSSSGSDHPTEFSDDKNTTGTMIFFREK